MQLWASTAQVTRAFPTQVAPAPVQPAGGVGHWHDLPWQVWWPRQAVSGPQLVQAPTATQVSTPTVPQRVWPTVQTLQVPPSIVAPPEPALPAWPPWPPWPLAPPSRSPAAPPVLVAAPPAPPS